MSGKVLEMRTMRRRAGMSGMGEDKNSSTSTSGAKVMAPITTQLTTAISPVFNVSSGGSATQSGSTSQSASPTVSAPLTDLQVPGAQGAMPGATGGYAADPYGTAQPAYNDPYGSTSSPYTPVSDEYTDTGLYPQQYNATQPANNNKMFLLLGMAAVAAFLILGKRKGKK